MLMGKVNTILLDKENYCTVSVLSCIVDFYMSKFLNLKSVLCRYLVMSMTSRPKPANAYVTMTLLNRDVGMP